MIRLNIRTMSWYSRRMFDLNKIVRYVLAALATFLIVPVGGEFFIELVREWGWLSNPSQKVKAVIDLISWLSGNWYFQIVTAVSVGLALGSCIDIIFKNHENRKKQEDRIKKIEHVKSEASKLAQVVINFIASQKRQSSMDTAYTMFDRQSFERSIVSSSANSASTMEEFYRNHYLKSREIAKIAIDVGIFDEKALLNFDHPTNPLGIEVVAQLLSDISSRAKQELIAIGRQELLDT